MTKRNLVVDRLEQRAKELYAGGSLNPGDVALVMELLAIVIRHLYGARK